MEATRTYLAFGVSFCAAVFANHIGDLYFCFGMTDVVDKLSRWTNPTLGLGKFLFGLVFCDCR